MNMHRYTIFFLSYLFPWGLCGQLNTSGAMTPAQLVQNLLVGQEVTVSNVTYSGSNGSIGSFNAANTSLNMEEGILMTTGVLSNTPPGPYGPNTDETAGMDNGTSGFGLLTNIVGTQTYNASILKFDFIPQSDTVRIDYIFACDDYSEFVNSEFNDVFAFLFRVLE